MDESELENVDFEMRAELEEHLYSMIHHNNSEIAVVSNLDTFLSRPPLSNAQNDSVIAFVGYGITGETQSKDDPETSVNVHNDTTLSEPKINTLSNNSSNTDVICIESSESEEDDIIVIEKPPPPLICIDSDESNDEDIGKVHLQDKQNSVIPKEHNQNDYHDHSELLKCTSPTSATSDEFIQNDCENLDISENNQFKFNTHHPELNFSSSTQVTDYIAGSDTSSECSELATNHDIFVHPEVVNQVSQIQDGYKNSESFIFNISNESCEISTDDIGTPSIEGDNALPDNISKHHSTPIRIHNDYSKEQIEDIATSNAIRKSFEEMQTFYFKSWGGENFNHSLIISKMSRDKDKWRISYSDKQGNQRNRGWKPIRCHNCHQMGHAALHCPEPKHIIKCYMCGIDGHAEPRCPNKICLRCGIPRSTFMIGCDNCRRTINYVCQLCRMTGHDQYNCPDLWRRYHRSIDSTKTPVPASQALKIPRHLFCSNCSNRGHLYHNCMKLRPNVHSLSLPNIIEYTSVYPVDAEKSSTRTKNESESKQNRNKRKSSSTKSSSKQTKLNESSFIDSLNDFEAMSSDDSCDYIKSPTTSFHSDTETKLPVCLDQQPPRTNFIDQTKIVQNSADQVGNFVKKNVGDDITQDNNVTSSEDEVSYNLMLDKETHAMLMKKEGTDFLRDTSKLINVKVQLQFSSTGGSLLLTGAKSQHEIFQKHLKDWIKQINSRSIKTTYSKMPNLPRKTLVLFNTLQIETAALRKRIGSPIVIHSRLKEIENDVASIITDKQIKLYHRNLKKLNTCLFGKLGYRDGNMHMEMLFLKMRELELLIAESREYTPDDLYNEIKLHYDYVFSSADHGNYEELLNLFKAQRFSTQQTTLTCGFSQTDKQKRQVNKMSTPEFINLENNSKQTPFTRGRSQSGKQIPRTNKMFPTPEFINLENNSKPTPCTRGQPQLGKQMPQTNKMFPTPDFINLENNSKQTLPTCGRPQSSKQMPHKQTMFPTPDFINLQNNINANANEIETNTKPFNQFLPNLPKKNLQNLGLLQDFNAVLRIASNKVDEANCSNAVRGKLRFKLKPYMRKSKHETVRRCDLRDLQRLIKSINKFN